MRITATYVLYTVPLGLVLGVLLAVAADRHLRGIKIFQTIFSSTVATSVAVASVVFFVLLNPQIGYFQNVGFLSLSNPDTALRGVALSSVWQNLGLTFIIVLAGLQAVPDEIQRGRHPRRLRAGAPLLPGHPAAHQPHPAVPRRGAGDLRLPGVRPVRHPHRGRAGRAPPRRSCYKIFYSQQPIDQGTGAIMAIGLFVHHRSWSPSSSTRSSTGGSTMGTEVRAPRWKTALWYVRPHAPSRC